MNKGRTAILAVLASLALQSQAQTVGVMADVDTGSMYPAAAERRFTELSGKRTSAAFTQGDIVTVTGIVQAVYSDTETAVAETSAFTSLFPLDRLAFENWGPEGQVVLTVAETNGIEGSLSGISDMSIITNGVRLVFASGGGVWVDRVGREIPAENEGDDPAIDPTYVYFHPAVESNTAYWVSAVRAVDLDDYGIHYGDATGLTSSFVYLDGSPSGDRPALATHDGITVYEAHYNGGVRKSTALFGSMATAPYTFIVTAVTNDVVSIKDFAVGVRGRGDVYCAIETDEDEWSVWGVGEYPLQWHVVARKDGGSWWVRSDTNGTFVSTAARSAAQALSCSLATNLYNRVPAEGYSPIYGYSAFTRGRPVKISFTFFPLAAYTNNSANVASVHVLSSRFANGFVWDTDTYDIRLVSTNPPVSEIGWPEAEETRSVIYYAPRKEEE